MAVIVRGDCANLKTSAGSAVVVHDRRSLGRGCGEGMKSLANLALDLSLVYVAGALAIPIILLLSVLSLWSEHRDAAVALMVVGAIVAIIVWIPAITNIKDCRAIKSEPTTSTEFESRIYNGKRYWVPRTVTNDNRRIELLEKNCGSFPYNQ